MDNLERYKQALHNDEEHLRLFLANVKEFNDTFCAAMLEFKDFTLKFEIKGDGGKITHCRVLSDKFDRPMKNQ